MHSLHLTHQSLVKDPPPPLFFPNSSILSINLIPLIPLQRRPPPRRRHRRRRRRRNRYRYSPTRSRRRIIRSTGFFGVRCGTWSGSGDVYGRRSSRRRRFSGSAGGAAVSSADVFEIGVAEVERAAVGVVFGFFCEGVKTHLFSFFFSFLGGRVVGVVFFLRLCIRFAD